ncbi:MAG: hypothetical protein WA532_04495 [Candidatus Korobacteraceae bacterium]
MAHAIKENPRPASFLSRLAKPVAATAGPVILFTAGGVRFAVEANEVEEIRDGEERGAACRLKGSKAIDFARQVGLGAGRLVRYLVIKPGDGASGGVTLGVTEVERMTSLPKVVPLPGLFQGAERQWYRGLLLLENEVIPLVRTKYWRQAGAPPGRTGTGQE